MNYSIISVILFIQTLFVFTESLSDIRAVELKTEYLLNPLSVDTTQPRLQWTLEATDPKKQNLSQNAYQILVATDQQSLAQNVGDLWDTKKVMSDRTTHITYNGTKLSSGQRAYWVVRVWDQEDRQSDNSRVAFWDKGLDISDWTAEWVGAPNGTQHKALENISEIDANVCLLLLIS